MNIITKMKENNFKQNYKSHHITTLPERETIIMNNSE
jgi:hypothetical protein